MYCTVTQVRDRAKTISDADTSGTPNGLIEEFIEEVDAEIDGALALRYAVPFSSTPVLVRSISADLAAVKTLEVALGKDFADNPLPTAQAWREAAYDKLDKLRDGRLDLIGLTATGALVGELPAVDLRNALAVEDDSTQVDTVENPDVPNSDLLSP